jgi:hypothetical protein
MSNFYGHHPNPIVPDPDDYYTKEETETLVLAVSATLDEHSEMKGLTVGDDHTQYHNDARGDIRYYQQGEVDLLSMEASANAFNQVETNVITNPDWNNAWYKDYTFFTSITSAAPSAAYQIDAVPGNLLVKANIMGLGGPPFNTHAAYTLQAFFKWDWLGPPTWQKVGLTTVLFEEEDDTNWFADIDVDPSGFLINVLVQGELVEWIVTVEWLMQPAPPP